MEATTCNNRSFSSGAQKIKEGAMEMKDAALQSGTEFKDSAFQRTAEFKDAAVQKAANLKDAAMRKGHEIADAAMKRGAEMKDAAVRKTTDTYNMARNETDAFVHANPYRTALIAFSIGALLGVMTTVSASRCARSE